MQSMHAVAKSACSCGKPLNEAMATSLCEDDIPGASLRGRSPSTLTIPALKRWLQCRAAPTKGKKADLVER